MTKLNFLAATAAGSFSAPCGASAARIFAGAGDGFGRVPGFIRIALKSDDGGGTDVELKTLAADFKKATDQVKTFAEKAEAEIKNLGKVTEETKANADKALTEMNGLGARLTDVEQKLDRRPGGGPEAQKSIGTQFVESEEFKAAAAQGDKYRGRVNIEVKTITSASVSGTSATTALVPVDRQAGMIGLPNRSLVVRDLLAPGNTNSGSIEYVRENTFVNNAASVAENPAAPKPQSDLTYALVNTPVRTIAHWMKASKQIMADAPALRSMIDGRLRYGLAYAEDVQLLNGDGTGTNLTGLNTVAVAYVAPSGVTVQNETMIDRLRLAMLQATLALYPSTGIVLHPTDWASIELKKDTQNRYLWGNPTGLIGPNIWGLPVAESLAEPQNNFLVGAFKYAAQIFDREDANVLMSTEDQDNFVKNMVTILAEERLALAIYRPAALIKGTFTGAA